MARIPLVCRVCGRDFVAPRFDAKTCTPTCRQRLRRGGDLAYLAGLGKRQQRAERKMHADWDGTKVEHRDYVAATRAGRRQLRELKAKEEHERLLNQIVGAAYRKVKEREHRREHRERVGIAVAGVLKLFAEQRRNDMSAEAIVTFFGFRALPGPLPGRGGRRAARRTQGRRRLRPHHRRGSRQVNHVRGGCVPLATCKGD
jgi:hypothetical protein